MRVNLAMCRIACLRNHAKCFQTFEAGIYQVLKARD